MNPEINSSIGVRLLETITSALYEDPIIIFREYVQNSVDAYNMAVDTDQSNQFEGFSVDIEIDKAKLSIRIVDNGYGIPPDDFNNKLTRVGSSEKSKFKNQIGFRGIGRLSAMPYCQRLTFTNKPKGSKRVQRFIWHGDKFNDLLNAGSEPGFEATLKEITESQDDEYQGSMDDHSFKVDIQGFDEGIIQLLESDNFADRLSKMLPLEYSPKFTYQHEIKQKYEDYMQQSLDRFSFAVKLDGQMLHKPYKDSDVLESGLIRLILNELCSAYAKPYFDVASDVLLEKPMQYGGRVCVAWNGHGCLICYDELDLAEAQSDLMSPNAKRDQEAVYGVPREVLGKAGPSVVSINGVVASLAVTEFMLVVTGVRNNPRRLLKYRAHMGRVSEDPDEPAPDCYYCKELRGKGDAADVQKYLRAGTQ